MNLKKMRLHLIKDDNDYIEEEGVSVVNKKVFGDNEERWYDMDCYDGYAIGHKSRYYEDENYSPATIKMTYPKISELSEDEKDEALQYRYGNDYYMYDVTYGDIMMCFGKVVGY